MERFHAEPAERVRLRSLIVSPDAQRREQLQALQAFQTGCAKFRHLAKTDEECCVQLMKLAECHFVGLWPRHSHEDSVWGRAGCNENDSRADQDRKLVRELLRRHLAIRTDHSPEWKKSVAIAAYLFCYYLTHPDHPARRPRTARQCEPGIVLLGIQDMALAVFVEAHRWDREIINRDWKRIRGEEGWIPKDRRLDFDSEPMQLILSRTLLSEEIYLLWLQRLDGLL